MQQVRITAGDLVRFKKRCRNLTEEYHMDADDVGLVVELLDLRLRGRNVIRVLHRGMLAYVSEGDVELV